jgi:protein involved in polysaccharide export with SLBB domain
MAQRHADALASPLMRLHAIAIAAVLAALAAVPAAAQNPGAELNQVQVTREALLDLQQRLEAAAASGSYSGEVRARAREMARRVQQRLVEGDLWPGDRVWIQVVGETALTDTFLIRQGRVLRLPGIGDIPVSGVLRSELQAHLTQELRRFVRAPEVHTQAIIRVTVTGAVGQQGYYSVPVEAGVNDVILIAGGLAPSARMDRLNIRRGNEILFGPTQVERVITIGASLDAIGLQAGDRIDVPAQATRNWWQVVATFNGLIALTFSIIAIVNSL